MSFVAQVRLSSAAARASDPAKQRRRALERVDRELWRGHFRSALSVVKQLKRKHGGLLAFASAKQIPKNLSTLDQLFDLNGTDLSSFRPLVDSIMDSILKCIEFASLDEISARNMVSLCDDEDGKSSLVDDRYLFVQHESGHFLVAYLLGVLPRYYEIPTVEALRQDKSATGKVEVVGFEFLKEVGVAEKVSKDTVNLEVYHKASRDSISSKALNNFTCVALGGLVTEHMLFGYSEGLRSDVDKLDSVLDWFGYTKNEAISHMRWAAFNSAYLLHQHKEARRSLAEAMALGKSVGSCIETIENTISQR